MSSPDEPPRSPLRTIGGPRGQRALIYLLLALLAFAGVAWVYDFALLRTSYPIDSVRPDQGKAFVGNLSANLSAHEGPVDAELYEIVERPGSVLHRLEPVLGDSHVFYRLKHAVDRRFPSLTHAERRALGPGNALHADIRETGGGAFSVWKGSVYFSTADGSDPTSSGRRYEISAQIVAPRVLAAVLAAAIVTVAVLAFHVHLRGIVRDCLAALRAGPVVRNVLPGVLVSLAVIVLVVILAELFFRGTAFHGKDIAWPTESDRVAGVLFKPGGTVRWTNNVEYWVEERANSLGFLDREPALPKPDGTFRVLIVGDSMVEAAQVRIADKVQTLLQDKLAGSLPNRGVDVVAMGFSGTGQANQLGFYEKHGRRIAPDLVLLVFVENDFSNNSVVLEALRYGFDPRHPPWLYLEASNTGDFERIAADPDWLGKRLPEGSLRDYYDHWLADPEIGPTLAGLVNDSTQGGDLSPFYLDRFCFLGELPAIYRKAMRATEEALDVWQRLAERDGFRLALVATARMTRADYPGLESRHSATECFDKLKRLADQRGLPLLDLHAAFSARGDIAETTWRYEGHWNETGHAWAADAIHDFLLSEGFLEAANAGG